jgi:hypothetical protein
MMTLITPNGNKEELSPGGWEHFSSNAKGAKKPRR